MLTKIKIGFMELSQEQFDLNKKLAILHDLPEATETSPEIVARHLPQVPSFVLCSDPPEQSTTTFNLFIRFVKKTYIYNEDFKRIVFYQYELD